MFSLLPPVTSHCVWLLLTPDELQPVKITNTRKNNMQLNFNVFMDDILNGGKNIQKNSHLRVGKKASGN